MRREKIKVKEEERKRERRRRRCKVKYERRRGKGRGNTRGERGEGSVIEEKRGDVHPHINTINILVGAGFLQYIPLIVFSLFVLQTNCTGSRSHDL